MCVRRDRLPEVCCAAGPGFRPDSRYTSGAGVVGEFLRDGLSYAMNQYRGSSNPTNWSTNGCDRDPQDVCQGWHRG